MKIDISRENRLKRNYNFKIGRRWNVHQTKLVRVSVRAWCRSYLIVNAHRCWWLFRICTNSIYFWNGTWKRPNSIVRPISIDKREGKWKRIRYPTIHQIIHPMNEERSNYLRVFVWLATDTYRYGTRACQTMVTTTTSTAFVAAIMEVINSFRLAIYEPRRSYCVLFDLIIVYLWCEISRFVE